MLGTEHSRPVLALGEDAPGETVLCFDWDGQWVISGFVIREGETYVEWETRIADAFRANRLVPGKLRGMRNGEEHVLVHGDRIVLPQTEEWGPHRRAVCRYLARSGWDIDVCDGWKITNTEKPFPAFWAWPCVDGAMVGEDAVAATWQDYGAP